MFFLHFAHKPSTKVHQFSRNCCANRNFLKLSFCVNFRTKQVLVNPKNQPRTGTHLVSIVCDGVCACVCVCPWLLLS